MTKNKAAIILTAVSAKNEEVKDGIKACKHRVPTSPYVERMLCMNEVWCYKCERRIETGEVYRRRTANGKGYHKYYHLSCLEKLYY